MTAQKSDKQALLEWEEFLEGIRNSTPVDANETEEAKRGRMRRLEKPGNQEEWFQYYFPKFAFAAPAEFHKESTRKILKASRLYQRRAWARGLAKSTRRMMEVFYLTFARKFPTNMLLCSKSEENAIRLLAPYKGNLEANARLINDYGVQERSGKWKEHEFLTRSKRAFRAVGAGQNPRGAKNDELRINIAVFDDLDDDEVCRSEERLDQQWQWVMESVIPTVDISAAYYIFFDNNIIAEDSCAVRAAGYADDVETVNIRMPDKEGNLVSSWKEKNSEEDIDYMLSIISYESGQKEYFNNAMTKGKTFDAITWGKCPPLKSLQFVVQYADPAPSNKDKPSLKSKAHTSSKAAFVIGKLGTKYYVYTGYLDHMSNSAFIDCLYANADYVGNETTAFHQVENNTLQDPFYEQVLLPLIYQKGRERGAVLGIKGDDRKKPDKWVRVESLEALVRLGLLVFNLDEKGNPHMLRLESQFKAAKATSKALDGPDCIEGGVFVINQKTIVHAGSVKSFGHRKHSKRI